MRVLVLNPGHERLPKRARLEVVTHFETRIEGAISCSSPTLVVQIHHGAGINFTVGYLWNVLKQKCFMRITTFARTLLFTALLHFYFISKVSKRREQNQVP